MDPHPLLLAAYLLGTYLVAAIPFGLVVFRVRTGKDIREEGSGNIGATNVLRSSGKGMRVVRFLAKPSNPGKRVEDIMFMERSSRVASFRNSRSVESGISTRKFSGSPMARRLSIKDKVTSPGTRKTLC